MLPPLRHPLLQRRFLIVAWILVALMPVLYIAANAITYSRNIVFWDEFDTALDLILRIDSGASWSEILQRFFALNNEHRTVTSRVMFAVSYWLTGTVNFHVIGAIGNLFLVGVCAILIAAARDWVRRIQLGVVLAFLLFQLEHFESFLWSGSSIDHFQVVMLGVGAIAALARKTSGGTALAVLLGFLATFTLAQGSVVWPVGACLLWQQRRWRELAVWIGCGVAAEAAFFHGFTYNPGHHIMSLSADRIARVAVYWLTLLGGPLTLGNAQYAAIPGAVLLVGLGFVWWRGAATREPAAMFSALFAAGALALVAFGRAELAGADVNSRYLVLGALAWALLAYILLNVGDEPAHPFRRLIWLMPALAAFNISANLKFAPLVAGFVEVRDRAATSFMQYGEDGRGLVRLHPQERHADVLLKMAEDRGVYRLPPVSHLKSFPNATLNPKIITHLDQLVVNDRAITAGGWAMIPGHVSQRGEIYLLLRSATSQRAFSSVTLQRPDVAKAYNKPEWRQSGFRVLIERDRLPAEDFDVGVLIVSHGRAEYIMTPQRIELAQESTSAAEELTNSP